MSDPYEADLGDDFEEVEDPADELDEPDEELEPDEPEDEPSEEEPAPRQQRQPSRGENRVAVATRTAAEAKREAEALRRELEALRAERNAPPRESPEQIRERLAQMDPVERLEYLRTQDRQEFQSTLQRIEFNAQESADRTAFEALCARNPTANKLRDEVETRLADMRRSGTTAPRETVLRWVIGDRALANANRATGRAQKTASANRERQQARPGAARGDVAATDRRGSGAQARDKRLENTSI